ncbi:unnamed protein product [Sphagnum balticum]
MQALHGMPKEIAWNNLVPGIPNLKDVFWIVLTHLIDMMSAGQIDNTVGMRNPSCDGLTTGQKNFKDRIERDIELVKSGRGLRCLQCEDLNKWVGEDMPNFHFKSLCPGSMGDDRRIYDSIVIERMEVYKVMWAKGKWLDNVQERYHCGIIVKNGEFPQQQFREVGFQGLPEKVKLAKEAILDRIVSFFLPSMPVTLILIFFSRLTGRHHQSQRTRTGVLPEASTITKAEAGVETGVVAGVVAEAVEATEVADF